MPLNNHTRFAQYMCAAMEKLMNVMADPNALAFRQVVSYVGIAKNAAHSAHERKMAENLMESVRIGADAMLFPYETIFGDSE